MAAIFVYWPMSLACADTVALMIGNNDYEHISRLRNPVNDTNSIAQKFKKAGVAHEVVTNATREEMEDALDRLRLASAGASVVMFYFAGHGIEVDGKNYLLPTGARIDSASKLETEAISLDRLLSRLGKCGTSSRVLVLDCCRDNPFARENWLAGYKGGLARIEVSALPPDTLVVYSGAPGKTVPDGAGDNSPFAKGVIENLSTGKSALNIFSSVATSIKSGQKPWMKFDGELAKLAPLVVTPLLGPPLEGGQVNLSLMLRIFEASGKEIEAHFQKDGMQNSPEHQRWLVARMKQRLTDVSKIYLPEGYYGPRGLATYLDAEINLLLRQQTAQTAKERNLEIQVLAIEAFEGEMVKLIVKRALGEDKAAAWMEQNGLNLY